MNKNCLSMVIFVHMTFDLFDVCVLFWTITSNYKTIKGEFLSEMHNVFLSNKNKTAVIK